MTVTSSNKTVKTDSPPVQNHNKPIPKTAQVVLGASNIEKEELDKINTVQSSNLKETFKIKYYDIYFATSSDEVKEKDFDFEMLPAIDPILTYTGGSGTLRGNPSIPEIKPGIPIRTVLKHKNINILGGKNVIQTIGIETKFINLVGAFLSKGEFSSYKLAEKFDHEVVQPGLEIKLELTSQTTSNSSAPTNIKLKGFITDFKVYAIRKDKTYYGISIICSDLEIVRKKSEEKETQTLTSTPTPETKPETKPETTSQPTPQPTSEPETKPETTPETKPETTSQPTTKPTPETKPEPTASTPASLTPAPESEETLINKITEIINASPSPVFGSLNEYKKLLTELDKDAKKIQTLANRITKNTTAKNNSLLEANSMLYTLYIVGPSRVHSINKLSGNGFSIKDMIDFYNKALSLNRKIRSFNLFDGESDKQNNKEEERQILDYLKKLNT